MRPVARRLAALVRLTDRPAAYRPHNPGRRPAPSDRYASIPRLPWPTKHNRKARRRRGRSRCPGVPRPGGCDRSGRVRQHSGSYPRPNGWSAPRTPAATSRRSCRSTRTGPPSPARSGRAYCRPDRSGSD
ncbi:hypothetical protein G6F65_022728 [Rhizopus arrhizus]|nr:hypothetical protein G6F65_022728 [Rhizopus arrhizus]